MTIKSMLKAEPLYLIDGSAFIFRGFYANQTLSRSDGFPTGALYVVARLLLRLLREEKPVRMVMILDGKGPTFRHELFPPYKSQRKAVPEELIMQISPIKRLTQALGIPLVVSEGCEADDCIATLAAREEQNGAAIIIGADKDLKQCLRSNILIWDPAGKEGKITTIDSFRAETGLEPQYWPDIQAVIGDTADNIPGVPGIGIKTAEKLFRDFMCLEDIRDRFSDLPPNLQKKFEGHMEAVFLYRQLTTMKTTCCEDIADKDLLVHTPDVLEVTSILREFELHSLVREVSNLFGKAQTSEKILTSVQGSLFDVKVSQLSHADTALSNQPMLENTDSEKRIAPIQALSDPSVIFNTYAQTNPSNAYISLVPEYDGLHIATGSKEWRFTGNISTLAHTVARICATHSSVRIVVPDLKHLFRSIPDFRIVPAIRWFDLALAEYLLNPEQGDYGWPRLSGHWSVMLDFAPSYPALLAIAIAQHCTGQLQSARLTPLMCSLELPLAPILADMEERGILLDHQKLNEFLEYATQHLHELTSQIYEAAGGEFNIRSAQQLGEVLFKRLKLPISGKTQSGQISTSKDVLDSLAGKHPVVDALLRYRVLEKLRSTYLEPLPRLADKHGRIHTTFNQTATATGRLSSSNPNLQNIPVRGEEGRKMRFCFTAPKGKMLVSADYSQIELRVLAHISQDPELISAFREGIDIHTRTASLLYGISIQDVSKEQRAAAKTINFGLIYGMGAQKLARELGIAFNEARDFIERYFEHLTTLKAFYERIKEDARSNGYVTTLSGRRRLLPNITSVAGQVRALAERQAVNTVIQGSAADIIKLAMISVTRDPKLAQMKAQMLLQIHDELLLEVPEEYAKEAGTRVAELMGAVKPSGISLSVPLLAEWGYGKSWGDAH